MSQFGEGEQVQLLEAVPEAELLDAVAKELAAAFPPEQIATDFDRFVAAVAGILLRRSFPGLLGLPFLQHLEQDVAAALLAHEASSTRLKRLWKAISIGRGSGRSVGGDG